MTEYQSDIWVMDLEFEAIPPRRGRGRAASVPICVSPWGAQPALSRTFPEAPCAQIPTFPARLINNHPPFGFGIDKPDVPVGLSRALVHDLPTV